MSFFSAISNTISSLAWQVSFDPTDYPGFPVTDWQNQVGLYEQAWNWYSGEALEVAQQQNGKKIDRYPVKINPFRNLVHKHAMALVGEVREDVKPPIAAHYLPQDRKNESDRAAAKAAEQFVNNVWMENNGPAIQVESAAISQIYGGCVFKLTYAPWETWRKNPLRIERVLPDCFAAIPNASDNWNLWEAWFINTIPASQAKAYGVTDVDPNIGAIMVEYWGPEDHYIKINEQYASITVGGKRYTFNEKNPYGFVPAVYIPHQRVGKFWGDGTILPLVGIVEELNLRFGDYGDAVSDDSHKYIAVRNIQGSPQIQRLGDGLPIVNLGSNAGLGGSEAQPDMFEVNKGSASEPMSDILVKLYQQFRRDGNIPAVADGEDEGSQRSSLTLTTRMWPLTSHIEEERLNWSTGLSILHHMMLLMAQNKKISNVSDSMLAQRHKLTYNPILPKDREALVTEGVNRVSNDIGSPMHIIDTFGDVDDVEGEMEAIYEYMRKKAEITAEAQAKFAPKPFGNEGGNSSGNPKSKTSAGGSK